MTASPADPQSGAPPLPHPASPILVNRPIRPDVDLATVSRFGDDRWDLSPAVFEENSQALSLNFLLIPEAHRQFAKTYAWLELNAEGSLLVLRRSKTSGRNSVRTLVSTMRHLRTFTAWLDAEHLATCSDVTAMTLDRYLKSVRQADLQETHKSDLLQAVRRLWAYRELLPERWRLPAEPCWGGKDSHALLGRPVRNPGNRTSRIPEAAMTTLLCWALRFIEDFSDDIIAVMQEYHPYLGKTPGTNGRAPASRRIRKPGSSGLRLELDQLLEQLRVSGEDLPGRAAEDGSLDVDWWHLARLLDCNYLNLQRHRAVIAESGVPIADDVYMKTRPQGVLDGQPWLGRVRFAEVGQLVRHLGTACLVVISYLSGMRAGEVLTLQRGCVTQDKETGLIFLTGRYWKNATDPSGAKIPEGKMRPDPWVVAEPVRRAVETAERLQGSAILFPSGTYRDESPHARVRARAYTEVNKDLNNFVEWVNGYCSRTGRTDVIGDTGGRLTASRFRRTLAWFICRRPRGLVAAAIQYGHVKVQVTQGYGGSYASGFPDELAFEDWLNRLDQLDAADRRLKGGEDVSGPAALAYRDRVAGGSDRFAGRVLHANRQLRTLLANPSLQIYPGNGMTCVFNAATALCQLIKTGDNPARTPDLDDCQPSCRNIARTDEDIATISGEISRLREIVADEASPPLRLAREHARLRYLEGLVREHQAAAGDGAS